MYKLTKRINHDSKELILKGTAGFLCKHCYEPIYVNVNYHASYNTVSPNNATAYIIPQFFIQCPVCNKLTKWVDLPIDPNILKAISIFNRKGYRTRMCCEGHGLFSTAWVTFYNNMEKAINKIYGIPEPWQLDESNKLLLANHLWSISTGGRLCTMKKKIETLEWFANELPTLKGSIIYRTNGSNNIKALFGGNKNNEN